MQGYESILNSIIRVSLAQKLRNISSHGSDNDNSYRDATLEFQSDGDGNKIEGAIAPQPEPFELEMIYVYRQL